MNIINEELYPVLNKILKEYYDVFKPELFHIGGDEVRFQHSHHTLLRSYNHGECIDSLRILIKTCSLIFVL